MEPQHPPLRLVVIGCGRVTEQCHLPALQTLAGIELVSLVDSDRDRLNKVGDRVGVRQRYSDYRVMLNDTSIDVVAVCVPPQFHAEIGLAVLDAGKHLFMEKPLALSLHEADQLVDRAAAAPSKALMGFNLRWHRLIRQARELIGGGCLGPLQTMHTSFTSRPGVMAHGTDWRRQHDLGGNVLFDLGIHHFDLWRFLMESEVEEVFARYGSDDPAVERATVSATMGNGALVTASFSHGLSDTNELEICGRTRRLRLSCYRFDSLRVWEHSAPHGAARDWLSGMGRAVRNLPQAVSGWRHGGDVIASYRAEWQHLVDTIRNDTRVQCSVDDARRALQVALATVESASCGQPVRVAHAARAISPIAPAARMSRTVDV